MLPYSDYDLAVPERNYHLFKEQCGLFPRMKYYIFFLYLSDYIFQYL